MTDWDILGVGTVTVDDLIYIDRFPQPDEKMPVQAQQRQGGGQTATALVAAARQGARTAFCACLGDDELSQFSVQALEQAGVDCTPIISVPGCKPIHAVVIVDTSTGSRTILYQMEGFSEPAEVALRPEWIANSRVVFIDQNYPRVGLRAAQLARDLGRPVIADLEKIDLPNLSRLLDSIDHLIVGTQFARQLTGQADPTAALRQLARAGRAVSVVTGGPLGCWYVEGDGPIQHFPAFEVAVVDTTGCGDVFHGVYAAAIARGEPTAQAIAAATAAAALKATCPGGRAGIPNRETVDRFLREYPLTG